MLGNLSFIHSLATVDGVQSKVSTQAEPIRALPEEFANCNREKEASVLLDA